MKKLTHCQKEFILRFFKDERYSGWRSIAIKLIENGECIVAGTDRIWVGGIGNFISLEPAENAVYCSLHKFDLKMFLESAWFQSCIEDEVNRLADVKIDLESQIKIVTNSMTDIFNLQNF